MAASRKVAVVTGANKGIGLAIVRRLCKEFDGDVVLTARDEARGQAAVAQLQSDGLSPKFHQLDLGSPPSIEALRAFLLADYKGLDVLINNAAIAYKGSSTAPFAEQAEVTLKTNFFDTLSVIQALMPLLRPHSRVVNISSRIGKLSILSPELRSQFSDPSLTEDRLVSLMRQFVTDVKDGDHGSKGWPNTAYGMSKVGLTALTKIHAREAAKNGHADVLVNACCPGWVKTDMAGDRAPLTPDQGAETPCLLALLPEGSPTGELWYDKAIGVW